MSDGKQLTPNGFITVDEVAIIAANHAMPREASEFDNGWVYDDHIDELERLAEKKEIKLFKDGLTPADQFSRHALMKLDAASEYLRESGADLGALERSKTATVFSGELELEPETSSKPKISLECFELGPEKSLNERIHQLHIAGKSYHVIKHELGLGITTSAIGERFRREERKRVKKNLA